MFQCAQDTAKAPSNHSFAALYFVYRSPNKNDHVFAAVTLLFTNQRLGQAIPKRPIRDDASKALWTSMVPFFAKAG